MVINNNLIFCYKAPMYKFDKKEMLLLIIYLSWKCDHLLPFLYIYFTCLLNNLCCHSLLYYLIVNIYLNINHVVYFDFRYRHALFTFPPSGIIEHWSFCYIKINLIDTIFVYMRFRICISAMFRFYWLWFHDYLV